MSFFAFLVRILRNIGGEIVATQEVFLKYAAGYGKEIPIMSPFAALYKIVVWVARSVVLILAVLFLSMLLMLGGRR
jgi:hypothetical protein